MPWNMCGSQVLPGMLGTMEHADLGALVAPRPLFVETGREDPLFPVAAAEALGRAAGRVYAHLGAADRLVHEISDGEHQWYGRGAYAFLDRHLGRPTVRIERRSPRPAGGPQRRAAESGSR